MKKILFLILFYVYNLNYIHAQGLGEWTWMKGSNTVYGLGTFGTKGISAPTNNPPAIYEGYEWTDLNGNFWVFGGLTSDEETNALWKYNPLTNEWTWMHGPSIFAGSGIYGTKGIPAPTNTPGARSWGGVTWVDNMGDLWLFGGAGYDALGNLGVLNDLWRYNINTNQWTWMNGTNSILTASTVVAGIKGIPNILNTPDGRQETNAGVTDGFGNLWLFGGLNSASIAYNDVWKYSVATNMWTWLAGDQTTSHSPVYGTFGVSAPTNDPGDRFCYTKFIDANNNLYFLGAGLNSYGSDNVVDVWKFSTTSTEWTWVGGSNILNEPGIYNAKCDTVQLNMPKAKYEVRASWPDSCGFFFFGGVGLASDTVGSYNDLWYYNIENNKFTLISGTNIISHAGSYGTKGFSLSSNLPPARGGALAFKDKDLNLWLFGGAEFWGSGSVGIFNDLWRFKYNPTCGKLCSKSGFYPVLQANFYASVICDNTPLTVNFTNSSIGATTYTWNYGDGSAPGYLANPSHTYPANGVYSVTLTAKGAGVQSDIFIQTNTFTDDICTNIYIPNVFTPNGDGANSLFKVKVTNYKNYHIIIYDRWGLKLFESTDVNLHWNGKPNNTGSDCPVGTYFYVINLTDKNDKTIDYNGFLTLIR